MRKIIFLFTTLLLIYAMPVAAWNAVGHRVIAQIAYDQLTPNVKKTVDTLTQVMFHSPYADARFARAAVWPDKIRQKDHATFIWHFIDQPITQDGVTAPPPNTENVVWAISQAEKTLENSHAGEMARAKSLSFLIHFVGDIHQPLHCAELYNHDFPQGDEGGNLYLIRSPIAGNLHAFWDRGAGLFVSHSAHYQFHYDQIQSIALRWMQQYPRSFFGARLKMHSPAQWAQESHQIAQSLAYTTPMNRAPSIQYLQESQDMVKEQVVLAGDCLADILNRIL